MFFSLIVIQKCFHHFLLRLSRIFIWNNPITWHIDINTFERPPHEIVKKRFFEMSMFLLPLVFKFAISFLCNSTCNGNAASVKQSQTITHTHTWQITFPIPVTVGGSRRTRREPTQPTTFPLLAGGANRSATASPSILCDHKENVILEPNSLFANAWWFPAC